MHDWVFLGLDFLWADGSCILKFKDSQSTERLICSVGLRNLIVPRLSDWGDSVCVNKIEGPFSENGFKLIKIEMQSGDQIVIEAARIDMP